MEKSTVTCDCFRGNLTVGMKKVASRLNVFVLTLNKPEVGHSYQPVDMNDLSWLGEMTLSVY